MIGTPAHREAIVEYLCNRLIDCERAIKAGALVILDAQDTLDTFMVDGQPDGDLFEANVGSVPTRR